MGKILIACDTNHIKAYVLGTDKLREIRGASSILDYLNRIIMTGKDKKEPLPCKVIPVYANGGGGIFVVDADDAAIFDADMQRKFQKWTGGGATIICVKQELPDEIKITEGGDDAEHLIDDPKIEPFLELIRWKLREKKLIPTQEIVSPSHPFMHPCDACGVFYAVPDIGKINRDADESGELFCESCQRKRRRDVQVKTLVEEMVKGYGIANEDYLWWKVINRLKELEYDLSTDPKRPEDFNVFSSFKSGKDYLALIYADANGMGKAFEECKGLKEYRDLAQTVDDAIYEAVCIAIARHLKISDHVEPGAPANEPPVFPFDILMMGGDDVLMVVPATVALDVALVISQEFQRIMRDAYPKNKKKWATISSGVVLAPIKYPFRLLESLATTTLKFAKDDGDGKPRINFVTVAGSAGETFIKVFDSLHTPSREYRRQVEKQFFATLRPYEPEKLTRLLAEIRKGRRRNLGRTKLHQMREAIMKMNLTTSVSESRAVLMNWKADQRDYVLDFVHTFANQHLNGTSENQNPEELHYERPFPWFFSEKKGERSIYRTPLLDFIELYDFVSGEEAVDGGTH